MNSLPLIEVARAWGLNVDAYNGLNSAAKGKYVRKTAIAVGVKNLATWDHELIHAARFCASGWYDTKRSTALLMSVAASVRVSSMRRRTTVSASATVAGCCARTVVRDRLASYSVFRRTVPPISHDNAFNFYHFVYVYAPSSLARMNA